MENTEAEQKALEKFKELKEQIKKGLWDDDSDVQDEVNQIIDVFLCDIGYENIMEEAVDTLYLFTGMQLEEGRNGKKD